MTSLHRGGLLEISLIFTALTLFPQSEAFFLNLPGMQNCCPSMMAPCCPFPSHHQQQGSSGFGSQLFSSYGVGRVFAPTGGNSYPTAPTGTAGGGRYATAGGYATQPAHPWVQHVHQQLAQHVAATQQHWNAHQAQYAMMPAYAAGPAPVQTSNSEPSYGFQTSTPEATTTFDEATFFGSESNTFENSSPSSPPPSFSEQIDEGVTMMYSTDQTREPLRQTPSGYSFTASPSPPPDDAFKIEVESASPKTEIATGSYFRSKPPKVLHPPAATQAVDEFSETATWTPVTSAAAADTRPPLSFSIDAEPTTVEKAELPQFAAASAAAAPAAQSQPQASPQSSQDLSSTELKELDDLDMLLITSDESFRPVTSQNPARPLTSEEKAGFTSNDISTIADGLPPNLNDVIFWPIGKDITLLKRAIALRRRRDDEAKKRLHRRQGDESASDLMYRSEQHRNRQPTPDERVSSFLASYLRRRAPSGDSHRILSGGQMDRSGARPRSAKTRRDILRSSILEKILAMEELLAET